MARRLTGPQKMAQYFMVADVGEERTVLDLPRMIVEAREGPKPTRKPKTPRAPREMRVSIPPNED